MISPRTFFIVGVPGAGVAAVAAWFNARDDAFALVNPHRRAIAQFTDGCEKVRPYWDGMHCKECAGREPTFRTVYSIYPRFVVPVTEAWFQLGGYGETWRGEDLDYRLLVRHIPLVDFWLCVTGGDVEYAERQRELVDIARVTSGIMINGGALRAGALVLEHVLQSVL
jgi:hypothetical protein